MQKIRWLLVIVGVLILLPWQPDVAHSQDSSSAIDYIAVTLDELTINGASTDESLRLMLGAVSASGNRVQKTIWPAAIWADGAASNPFLTDEHSAIPLFALPEDQLGEELGFALIVFDNRIEPDQFPQGWLNNTLPAVVEAAADPIALWVTGQPTSPEEEASRISEVIVPLLGKNAQLGVIAAKFNSADDWGVREEPYEASAADLHIKYRIWRVSTPKNASVEVILNSIQVEKTGRSEDEPVQLFIWTRSATAFAGEGFNGLLRRLPFVDQYELQEGQSQALDEVLYSGELGPFLYLELGVWDQHPDGPRSLGMLTDLWTVEGLAGDPPGSFEVTLQGADGAEVTLSLSIEVSGLRQPPVIAVDQESLQFEGQIGRPDPAAQTLRITNEGGGTLRWTATADESWVSLSQTRGELQAGASESVNVSVRIAGLSEGTHRANITITAPGAQGSPAVVAVSLTLQAAPPRTLRVPQDFTTIQAAIDAARDGDIILISPGTYREQIRIARRITLKARTSGAVEIISNSRFSGPDLDPAITVTGARGVALEGLSIQKGYPALLITEGAQAVVDRLTITESFVGIMVADGATAVISNNILSSNMRFGVFLFESGRVEITETSITGTLPNPQGAPGFGILVQGATELTVIRNNLISENTWDGIQILRASAEITDNTITNNVGCGVKIGQGGVATGKDNEISGNGTDLCGGPFPPGFKKP